MQISLKKSSWHYKIQKYVFDYPPHLGSLCPYFWLTILCILLSPFFFVGKSINGAYNKFLDYIYKNMDIDTAAKYYVKANVMGSRSSYERYEQAMIDKVGYEVYFRDILPRLKKVLDEYMADQAIRREKIAKRNRRRKKQIDFIVKYTKWIVFAFLAALVAGIGYLLYAYAFPFIVAEWKGILWTLLGIAILLVAFLLVAFAISFIFKLRLFSKLSFLLKPFKSFGNFVFIYLKSTKDNYCPMIKWEN